MTSRFVETPAPHSLSGCGVRHQERHADCRPAHPVAHDGQRAERSMITDNSVTTGYEAEFREMAGALRGSMDAGEYNHVGLSLLVCGLPGVAERWVLPGATGRGGLHECKYRPGQASSFLTAARTSLNPEYGAARSGAPPSCHTRRDSPSNRANGSSSPPTSDRRVAQAG